MRNISLLTFGYGLTSKITLFIALVRIKLGVSKPFVCKLTIDGKASVLVHFTGTRDEFTILKDLFGKQEYAISNTTQVHNILDLGANIGLASAWFRLTYPKALIHAYEPAPHAFAILQKNAQSIGNMKIYAEAIGASEGTIVFHESDRSVASSIIESSALQTSYSINVPMIRIDTAIERMGSVDLLKIDIEGAEFDALGASKSVSTVAYITGEAHPNAAQRDIREIESALTQTHNVTIRNSGRLALFNATIK